MRLDALQGRVVGDASLGDGLELTGEQPDKVVWTLGQDIIKLGLEYLK